jgi:hypothetical protein
MKKQLSLHSAIIAAGVVSFGLSAPTQASALFSTDFESDAVGALTATNVNPSEVGGFRQNFQAAVVRDSSSFAPFGAGNQYLQIGGPDISENWAANNAFINARAIVTGAAPASNFTSGVVGISFKFYHEASNSWGTHIGVGTGNNPWVPDLTGTNGLFALSFRDGAITVGNNTTLAVGTLPSYTRGQAYEISYYMNWSGAQQTVPGLAGSVTLENKQTAFWMRDLGDDSLTSTVLLTSSLANTSDHISPVFRNFNSTQANESIVFIDDLTIAVIPEPSTWALIMGLSMLGLVGGARHRRNRKAA